MAEDLGKCFWLFETKENLTATIKLKLENTTTLQLKGTGAVYTSPIWF